MNYHRDKDYISFEGMFRNMFEKRFNIIQPHFAHSASLKASRGKVLDIGCSNGVFLDLFKEKGWETWGTEPSKNALVARQKGHKIQKVHIENAKLPENYFDLVILNHTLEHLKNPLDVLKIANMVLNKNGFVFIDVPNFGSLSSKLLGKRWPYLLPGEHKHQFTKDSLSELLQKAGFKIIHWESRSGLFEYANPLLELYQSLAGLKKRFMTDLLVFPYSLIATLLNMGDSMSIIGKKVN